MTGYIFIKMINEIFCKDNIWSTKIIPSLLYENYNKEFYEKHFNKINIMFLKDIDHIKIK
jgi:hypothetical protein